MHTSAILKNTNMYCTNNEFIIVVRCDWNVLDEWKSFIIPRPDTNGKYEHFNVISLLKKKIAKSSEQNVT